MIVRALIRPTGSLLRSTLAITLSLSLFLAVPLSAGGRRRTVAVSPASSALSITFVEALGTSDASIDAGTLAWTGERGRGARTTRTVGLRVGPPSREPRGTVTLLAAVENPAGSLVRVNGLLLGPALRVVQRNVPIGRVATYRMEIEVPRNSADGAIATTIRWEVTEP
jgi:hypothetical protein